MQRAEHAARAFRSAGSGGRQRLIEHGAGLGKLCLLQGFGHFELHGHPAQRVGHGVVQFSRQAVALVADSELFQRHRYA